MAIAGLHAAITAVQAASTRIATTSNNIANMRTTGYKKFAVQTADLFYNNIKKAGIAENAEAAKRPVGAQVGIGTRVDGVYRILSQGDLRRTDQPLDIALTGPGYFAITLPNGLTGYTRKGAFQLDSDRRLVTINGDPLDDDITIPENIETQDIHISANGTVTYTDRTANPPQEVELGTITLYNFPNERGLEAQGSDLFLVTAGSGEAEALADQNNHFKQSYLEDSNVSSVEELTTMIEDQRAYELATRVIRTADEMASELNSIKS